MGSNPSDGLGGEGGLDRGPDRVALLFLPLFLLQLINYRHTELELA